MDDPTTTAPSAPEASAARTAAGRWLQEALRTALLRRPRWDGLSVTPGGLLGLVMASEAMSLLLDRLYIAGPADFHLHAFTHGWLMAAALAGCSWVLRSRAPGATPRAVELFALLWLQGLVVGALCSLFAVPLLRSGQWGGPGTAMMLLSWLPLAWVTLAMVVLALRASAHEAPPPGWRVAALGTLVAAQIAVAFMPPPRFWYPAFDPSADTAMPRLTPEQLEAQPRLLAEQTAALAAERPGLVDVYALTFAPFADEDVFKRESALVAEVMASRFDAAGRTMQLVSHRATLDTFVLATPRNLERAIQAAARRMNREEDILFIHLTSHGAASGALAASLWPLDIAEVRPEQVKAWLDAAGVKRRIVSVSACYSGTWIAPLSDEHTLVMSAADPKHTSYGCGRHSELTYFGRAMYDEELRRTWSFEKAHAAARGVIEQREREAGKPDGYSNPQLHLGGTVRRALAELEAQLAARAKP